MHPNFKRKTKTRDILLNFFQKSSGSFSVQEIKDGIEKELGIVMTLSTIYRNIDFLLGEGYLIPSVRSSGILVYAVNNCHTNHKMQCVSCQKEVVLPFCPITLLNTTLEKEVGIHLLDAESSLKGKCISCK